MVLLTPIKKLAIADAVQFHEIQLATFNLAKHSFLLFRKSVLKADQYNVCVKWKTTI